MDWIADYSFDWQHLPTHYLVIGGEFSTQGTGGSDALHVQVNGIKAWFCSINIWYDTDLCMGLGGNAGYKAEW